MEHCKSILQLCMKGDSRFHAISKTRMATFASRDLTLRENYALMRAVYMEARDFGVRSVVWAIPTMILRCSKERQVQQVFQHMENYNSTSRRCILQNAVSVVLCVALIAS